MCADALAGSLLFSHCYLGVVFYMVVCGVCVRVCVCVRACMCVRVWVGAMCTLGAWSPSGWVVGIPWVYFTTQTLPTSVGKTRPHRGSSTRPSHGPAMAYMSHGRADAESLLEFMDSRRRPTLEILVIFLGQPTSAEVGDASPTFL